VSLGFSRLRPWRRLSKAPPSNDGVGTSRGSRRDGPKITMSKNKRRQPAKLNEANSKLVSDISNTRAAQWVFENMGGVEVYDGVSLNEAFTQADIELALDDRGWLVGGKRMAGELDPLSRQVQVNRNRYYWLRDPLAKQAVRLWTDYTLGDMAMCWKAQLPSDDDVDEADEGKEVDQETQDVLDEFMCGRRNRLICSRAGQHRLMKKWLIDGEIFLAFFDDPKGMTVRNFDCLQIPDFITNPDDEDDVWGFKRVITPRGWGSQQTSVGVNKTLYYKSWTCPDEAQPVDPATQKPVTFESGVVMYHLPFDNLTARGNGLLSCCSDWSREHRRFMTARVALTQAMSKFAWKATTKGGQKMVNTMRAKLESTFAQTGLSGGPEHQPPTAPGGVWVQNEGIDLQSIPRSTGAGDSKTDSDNLKLQVCAGTGIGLHYFGDNSTGNLSTSVTMELPMLKMFMSAQVMWKDAWREMFSIVLGEEEGDEPKDVVIELPPILEDDIQKLGQFLTGLTQIWPEAKVPELLRQALMSANVNNLDDVMEAIEDNRETMDTNIAAGKNPDGSTPTPIAVAGLKNGTPSAGGSNGTSQDATEVEKLTKLLAAIEKLSESLEAPVITRPITMVESPEINLSIENKHEAKTTKKIGKVTREKDGSMKFKIEEESTNG
jgi:hypothetical protein